MSANPNAGAGDGIFIDKKAGQIGIPKKSFGKLFLYRPIVIYKRPNRHVSFKRESILRFSLDALNKNLVVEELTGSPFDNSKELKFSMVNTLVADLKGDVAWINPKQFKNSNVDAALWEGKIHNSTQIDSSDISLSSSILTELTQKDSASVFWKISGITDVDTKQFNRRDDKRGPDIKTPADVQVLLSLRKPMSPNFVPEVASATMTGSFFNNFPLFGEGGNGILLAQKPSRDKIYNFIITDSWSKEERKAVCEGVLYWNLWVDKPITRCSFAEDSKIESPNDEGTVIRQLNEIVDYSPWSEWHSDPFTGEILSGEISIPRGYLDGNEVMLSELAATKGKSRIFKNSREVNLRIRINSIRQVIAHEVGHELGMRHNFAGSNIQSLAKKYILKIFSDIIDQNDKTPPTLALSSSVMDYFSFAIKPLLGDIIHQIEETPALVSQTPNFGYDKMRIRQLLGYPQTAENFDFCTDEEKGQIGCRRFDTGPNPFDEAAYDDASFSRRTAIQYLDKLRNFEEPQVKGDLKQNISQINISNSEYVYDGGIKDFFYAFSSLRHVNLSKSKFLSFDDQYFDEMRKADEELLYKYMKAADEVKFSYFEPGMESSVANDLAWALDQPAEQIFGFEVPDLSAEARQRIAKFIPAIAHHIVQGARAETLLLLRNMTRDTDIGDYRQTEKTEFINPYLTKALTPEGEALKEKFVSLIEKMLNAVINDESFPAQDLKVGLQILDLRRWEEPWVALKIRDDITQALLGQQILRQALSPRSSWILDEISKLK